MNTVITEIPRNRPIFISGLCSGRHFSSIWGQHAVWLYFSRFEALLPSSKEFMKLAAIKPLADLLQLQTEPLKAQLNVSREKNYLVRTRNLSWALYAISCARDGLISFALDNFFLSMSLRGLRTVDSILNKFLGIATFNVKNHYLTESWSMLVFIM